MKKIILFLMVAVATIAFADAYQVGDVVADFNFQDSNLDDGGNVVITNESIHSIIDAGHILVINFAGITCLDCNKQQPDLEEIWQHFEAENPGMLHMVTAVEGAMEWDALNAETWRTKTFPGQSGPIPLTFFLAKHDQFEGVHSTFVPGYDPYNIVIGKDYKMKYGQEGYDPDTFKDNLQSAIAEAGISTEVVKNFALSQNYPNPFNPSTTIKFELKSNTFVNLTVYNSAGKEVANLINGKISQGEHTVGFKANNFSAGIYYYKLTAGNYSESKKMLLVK